MSLISSSTLSSSFRICVERVSLSTLNGEGELVSEEGDVVSRSVDVVGGVSVGAVESFMRPYDGVVR